MTRGQAGDRLNVEAVTPLVKPQTVTTLQAIVAAVAVEGAHHQEPCEFAMRPGRGLQRHAGKTGDQRQPALQIRRQKLVSGGLPSRGEDFTGKTATAIGWGKLDENDAAHSDLLRQAVFSIRV